MRKRLIWIAWLSAAAIAILLVSPGQMKAEPLASGPQEADAAYRAFNAKLKFVGQLNGFNFYDPATARSRGPDKCASEPATWVEAEEFTGSVLDFHLAYAPINTKESQVSGSQCAGQVVTINRWYTSPSGGFAITRVAGPPDVPAWAPREHLQTATLGDRPAVISPSVYGKHRMAIWMRDGVSLWNISCVGMNVPECSHIAAEVR
jgi:hypothetical protein